MIIENLAFEKIVASPIFVDQYGRPLLIYGPLSFFFCFFFFEFRETLCLVVKLSTLQHQAWPGVQAAGVGR